MPTRLDPIIFGKDKSANLANFDLGKVLNAISQDLEEFGKKGVQGVKVNPNINNFIKYEKSAKRAADPYLQAGVANGSLVLVLLDKKNAKFEAMDMLVKGYAALKADLAKKTAKVVNISPDKNEDIIKGAAKAQADKFKTTVSNEDNPDFGGITGNVILCAHGRPKALPSGRLIGEAFGRKSPEDIVKILTGDKDKKKRIGKDYSGVITLSGCFTASGGPEGSKQDDAFALKVLNLLRKKGYAKASVVGMPGPSITARNDGETDTAGTVMKTGDKHVQANIRTAADSAKQKKLQADLNKAIEEYKAAVDAYNALVDSHNATKAAYAKAQNDFKVKKDGFKGTKEAFAQDAAVKKLVAQVAKTKAVFEKSQTAIGKAKTAYEKKKTAYEAKQKALKDSGLTDTVADIKGAFGLRTLN